MGAVFITLHYFASSLLLDSHALYLYIARALKSTYNCLVAPVLRQTPLGVELNGVRASATTMANGGTIKGTKIIGSVMLYILVNTAYR